LSYGCMERANTNSMQRVSECGSVVFYGAAPRLRRTAARWGGGGPPPRGAPPPKHLSSFRRLLIANGISWYPSRLFRPPCNTNSGQRVSECRRVELCHFPAQTFFLGGTCPQRPRPIGRGRSKCPSYHPPTPYTLSPLLKGGEGRGEGGSYTHVPCPFGALLVTLCQIFSKRFLNGKGDMGAPIPSSH
jgi:hypothetical protein